MIFDRYFDNSHESYISQVLNFASGTEQAISRKILPAKIYTNKVNPIDEWRRTVILVAFGSCIENC